MDEEALACCVAELKLESAKYHYSDPRKAMRIAQQARSFSEQSDNPATQALGIWAVATASLYLDRWGKAVALYDRAGAMYRALGDELTVAHMHASLVWALAYSGNPERALEVAAQIEPTLRQCADTDEQCALSLYRLLNNLGIVYDVVGQPDRALDAYDRALGIVERIGDPAKVAQTQINRALALYGLNLIEEAEHAFELTRAMLLQHTPDDVANFVLVDLNLGILHASHGRVDRALAALGKAENALRTMEGVDTQLLTVQTYSAAVKTLSDDADVIRAGRGELLKLWPVIQARLPRFEQGLTQLRLSALALRLGELDQANAAAWAALELAAGHAGAAFRWNARFALAQVALRGENASAAMVHLREAIRELEELEEEVRVDTLRASFLSDKLDVYHTLIELCLTQGDTAQALMVAQRAKARELRRGLLTRASASLSLQKLREQAPEQAAQVDMLRTKLGGMYRRKRLAQVKAQANDVLGLGDSSTDQAAHADELATVERELRDALRTAGRIVHDQDALDLDAWSAESLCQQLQPDELLIEYVWMSSRLWAIVSDSAGRISAHALGETRTIERQCEQYRAAIDRALSIYASPAQDRLASALLRDVRVVGSALRLSLLQPLVEQLSFLVANRTLVIASDGPLNQIPFHALPDALGRPVLLDHTVRYIASAAFAQKTVRKRVRKCVGISGAMEHEQAAQGEFASLKNMFATARTFSYADIAPEMLIEVGDGCDFLHLSTHASVHPYEPSLTAFAVGGRDMTVDELDRMRLNDACVVLSACESLRGWRAGADVFSLGRSFIAAGATTLVTSLWRIAEDTTAEQLSNFYAELAAGHNVCAALRRTQMRWLESAKGLLVHPAFWAPLVTFGADMIFEA